MSARSRRLYSLLQAGRWLAEAHPDVTSPEQWPRELAAEFVSAVDRLRVGECAVSSKRSRCPGPSDRPLRPRSKHGILAAVRAFFRECQEWGWLLLRLDPGRALATPRSIRALIAPNPRVIADDIWAKLLAAGLSLREEDLPAVIFRGQGPRACGLWVAPLRAAGSVGKRVHLPTTSGGVIRAPHLNRSGHEEVTEGSASRKSNAGRGVSPPREKYSEANQRVQSESATGPLVGRPRGAGKHSVRWF